MAVAPPRRSTAAWVIYDLANTIFALGVSGLYFAAWLTDRGREDVELSLAVAAAMVVVIFTSPWLGARSDHAGHRVRFLIPTTLLAVIPTFFLASFGVAVSLILYVVALIGFNLGGVVYDALLPDVSTPENRGTVSGLGVGTGYVGSFIALGIGVALLDRYGYPAVFRTIAVAFLLFALPSFLFIREQAAARRRGPPPRLRHSPRVLWQAWQKARRFPGVARFLVGRFLYTDAVNTLIGGFLTIFVKRELGFSDSQVEALLGLAIVTAIAGGLAAGPLVDRFGPRRMLHGVLYLWMVSLAAGVVAAVTDLVALAWGLGAAGGVALGAMWATDRVYMMRISPPSHLGELFGIYATVGRFATVLGPLVWGVLVSVLGFSRIVAVGALVVFVVAARVVLHGVDDAPRDWAALGDQPSAGPSSGSPSTPAR